MSKNNKHIQLSQCIICKEEICICIAKHKGKNNRKPRKQNHKELLNMYFADAHTETSDTPSLDKSSSSISTRGYLSPREKSEIQMKILKPKNRHQEEYYKILQNPMKKIVVVTGPAGTGKTMYAASVGCFHFLTGKCDKLIFTRPSVSVDEDLGYLPGTLEEKMAPWIRPIYDVLYQFISPHEVLQYIEDKIIEIAPLGYMRGRTFKNAWIVADEMQNSTISQMKMLMTRIGENSRIIITGDLEQYDRQNEINGMEDFLSKFKGKRSDSIDSFQFEHSDIQREEVVKEVLEIYASEIICPET